MDYELNLPLELASVHLVFHISMSRKCIIDLSIIVPLGNVSIVENLTFEEGSVGILEQQVKRLRNKKIAFTKTLWRNHKVKSAT